MKYTFIAALLIASPAFADASLCKNTTTGLAALSSIKNDLKALTAFCAAKTSDECQLIRAAYEKSENGENGSGLLAALWAKSEACK